MHRLLSLFASSSPRLMGLLLALAPAAGIAAPFVEFDIAPTAECRDVTPPQRIAEYPNQRLVEVTLPVSVRFRGASMDEVDELAIEVTGASPGMRVDDFAPTTQLASDISQAIETTIISKKNRSLDGSLGGTFPVPGAEAVAHLTPSISAGIADCDTETEKINRLPPKHAVVVSGTSSSGRGVFFKLKRYSQTSLEGVHELKVTFVTARVWKWSEIRVDCTARGEQRLFWMKQTGTIGQAHRTVQLVAMTARPVRQTVLKPSEAEQTVVKPKPAEKPVPTTPEGWRAALHSAISTEVAAHLADEPRSKTAKSVSAAKSAIDD